MVRKDWRSTFTSAWDSISYWDSYQQVVRVDLFIVAKSFKLEFLPLITSTSSALCEGSAQHTSLQLRWLFDLSRSSIVWLLVLKYYKVITSRWPLDLSRLVSKFWQWRTSCALWLSYVRVIASEPSTCSCHSFQLLRPHLRKCSLTLQW